MNQYLYEALTYMVGVGVAVSELEHAMARLPEQHRQPIYDHISTILGGYASYVGQLPEDTKEEAYEWMETYHQLAELAVVMSKDAEELTERSVSIFKMAKAALEKEYYNA